MAQVLYRKYRPQKFSEVVGQEHIIQTLQNALKSDAVAHAYLFCGPRGTGKTTMARILASELKCDPVDIIEIDAASNRGIDEIRALREAVRFAPNKSPYKVYIIDEVHMLSKDAFNALLKTLEEPPAHVIFILATTEAHKVLPTIVSRTQRFDFRFLTYAEIVKQLKKIAKKEGRELDDESIRLVAAAAGGSMRDASSILGKVLALEDPTPKSVRAVLGIADMATVRVFVDALIGRNHDRAIHVVNDMARSGSDLAQFAEAAVQYARTLLVMKLSPSSHAIVTASYTKEETEAAQAHLAELSVRDIYKMIGSLVEAVQAMKYAPIPELPLELAVAVLTESENGSMAKS